MQGLHLTADLYQCAGDTAYMLCADTIATLCRAQVQASGLTLVDERWVTFPPYNGQPGGVTGTVLLAESHLAIHTWPETGNVTVDVYVCNFSADNSGKARALMEGVIAAYAPGRRVCQELQRGDIGPGGASPTEWVQEQLTPDACFAFAATRHTQQRTPYQTLELMETPRFGRVLRLDGRFMTSEREEFFYHEALVHPAAVAHPAPRKALILGGGDGGGRPRSCSSIPASSAWCWPSLTPPWSRRRAPTCTPCTVARSTTRACNCTWAMAWLSSTPRRSASTSY